MIKTLKSDAIRSALADQGLSQKQLAEKTGVSSQAVTNWLKGKDFPRPAALLKLATTLQLNFDQLVQTSDADQPVIAFRKKANAKTTAIHMDKAKNVGMLLKPLVPYLQNLSTLRTLITSPSTDYEKIQTAVAQTRSRLGIGEKAVLGYEHIISEFSNCGAVLTPVLWGAKGNHENALHIRLPREDVTFIFLNLDTRLEDFKFWMAHELAHVYTPALAGTDEGEDYADAFAGALLFPEAMAEDAYHEALHHNHSDGILKLFLKYARANMISLYSVYKQVLHYIRANKLPPLPIEERAIHAARNSLPGEMISEALFDPLPPPPEVYIAACKNEFDSDFFEALRRLVHEKDIGPSYIQQVLNTSVLDARALHEEIRH
ncbi:MAG: helix-turn-helix domain-containing protein [Gammaproteobacteria bacterium]|nr:helix-turn-helix domain-containing protein [Gammaproteobacteria bacterium]